MLIRLMILWTESQIDFHISDKIRLNQKTPMLNRGKGGSQEPSWTEKVKVCDI